MRCLCACAHARPRAPACVCVYVCVCVPSQFFSHSVESSKRPWWRPHNVRTCNDQHTPQRTCSSPCDRQGDHLSKCCVADTDQTDRQTNGLTGGGQQSQDGMIEWQMTRSPLIVSSSLSLFFISCASWRLALCRISRHPRCTRQGR